MRVMADAQLARWLDALAAQKTLIAPKDVEGVLLYRPVSGRAEIVLEAGGDRPVRPVLSVKEAMFPATERLLTIEKTGQQLRLNETLPGGEQVIFGVRPCDARGVRALDAAFLETEPVDRYYARRRALTTLVGLACRAMGESCFCTSVGGAPDDPTGLDLLLTEVEGGYAVQVVTDRGEALLDGIPLEDVPGEPPPPILNDPIPVPGKEAWPPHFNDHYWAEVPSAA